MIDDIFTSHPKAELRIFIINNAYLTNTNGTKVPKSDIANTHLLFVLNINNENNQTKTEKAQIIKKDPAPPHKKKILFANIRRLLLTQILLFPSQLYTITNQGNNPIINIPVVNVIRYPLFFCNILIIGGINYLPSPHFN